MVRNLVADQRETFVTLQETKLDDIYRDMVVQILGEGVADNFVFLPAIGTREGILTAVDETFFKLMEMDRGIHSITAKVSMPTSLLDWYITTVYGLQEDDDKLQFLGELRWMQHLVSDRWLVLGDFNLILQASDKINDNLNRWLMG